MGWVVWVLLTLLGCATGYVVAAVVFPERPLLERGLIALTLQWALTLAALLATGLVGLLQRWVLGPVSLLLFLAVAAGCARTRWPAVRALACEDVRRLRRAGRALLRPFSVAVLALVPGVLALGTVLLSVWYFKTWSWDAAWYHVPMIDFMLSSHRVGPIPSHVPQMAFPRNVELLGAWNCIFPMDNRLDDSAQVGFLLAGAMLVAAWSRRLGASWGWAVGLGAAWIALPPIFLLAGTADIDIATGVLLGIAVFHLARSSKARDLFVALVALGIYLGAKYQGVVHLALLSPWILFRVVQNLRRPAWARAAVWIAGGVAACLALGATFYVENAIVRGNPFFPVPFQIPFTTTVLPGSTASDLFPFEVGIWSRGTHALYFQEPGSLALLINSWLNPHPDYIPDVKSGGFGPLFRWMLLPAMLIVLVDALRRRRWRQSLPLVALFVVAMGVPMTEYPRYIVGASLASVVGLGFVASEFSAPLAGLGLGLAFVALTWQGYEDARVGSERFSPFPRYLSQAIQASPTLRSCLRIDGNLWPQDACLAKEREFQPGDVFVYDEGGYFLSELSCRDFRNKVRFLSSRVAPEQFRAQLLTFRPRWVGVLQGGPGEAVVQSLGGQYLFTAPSTGLAVYRLRSGG